MNNTGVKSGGRTKGTPNKLTKELRTILKDVIAGELEELPYHFEQLDSKTRIELLAKLLPYAMPKVEQTSYRVGEGDGIWDAL